MLFIGYPKCTTCQKAEKWLNEHGFKYDARHIKEQNPSKEELAEWIKMSGIAARKFFNTSGILYRSLSLKEKLDSMSEDEQISLLATDGMLVKRPILINGTTMLIGFNEKKWEDCLK